MKIRPATIHDIDALCALEQRAFSADKYHLMKRAQYRHLLTKGNADLIVALDGEKLCGMVMLLYRAGGKMARMYSIAVDPDYQGGEVGKKLFEAAQGQVSEKGLQGMIIEIRTDNQRHLERYQKHGYKIDRQVADYYPDGSPCYKLKKIF